MSPEIADQIKAWVDFVSTPLPLLIVALIGMFSHFLKKNMKGETNTNMLDYFKDNIASTINALIWVVFSYFVYLQTIYTGGGVLDISAVFMLGYTFDSLMNKYDTGDLTVKTVTVPKVKSPVEKKPVVISKTTKKK